MATPTTSQHFKLAQCIICSAECLDIAGRRPMCGDCAADFKRRKERVVDRVRQTTQIDARPQAHRTTSFETQQQTEGILMKRTRSLASPRIRAGSYDTYRKGKLETDSSMKSWDHKEVEYLNKVKDKQDGKLSFFERLIRVAMC